MLMSCDKPAQEDENWKGCRLIWAVQLEFIAYEHEWSFVLRNYSIFTFLYCSTKWFITKSFHFKLHKEKPINIRMDFGSKCANFKPSEAALQNFLDELTNVRIPPAKRTRLGLRYANTFEVQRLISNLRMNSSFPNRNYECFNEDLHLNVAISALKEILTELYGGIFIASDIGEEYTRLFSEVNLDTQFEFALRTVKRFIKILPSNRRHLTHLIFRVLKNLAEQSAGFLTDSYTDLLLLFTPVLFPESVKQIRHFLQAIRISLLLIDFCEIIFKPFYDDSPLCDSAYFSDDEFISDDWENISTCVNTIETLSEAAKTCDSFSADSFNNTDDIEMCSPNGSGSCNEMFEEDMADCCFEFEQSFTTISCLNTDNNSSNYYVLAFTNIE